VVPKSLSFLGYLLLFAAEDKDIMRVRKIDKYLPVDTA
jgi:hypothetical protein